MTLLSKEMLDDRGLMSLNDALRNVPGITLGAGEFSWQGNNPTIRGFSSRDDMYLDGLRDFGSYPRDPFNLESVEVLLGPSSILFGRGSTGGAINQATKQPQRERLTSLALNVGSDETVRATADLGRPLALLGDTSAFRLNVLAHDGEAEDRADRKRRRFGIAPSLALGIGTDTQVNVQLLECRRRTTAPTTVCRGSARARAGGRATTSTASRTTTSRRTPVIATAQSCIASAIRSVSTCRRAMPTTSATCASRSP